MQNYKYFLLEIIFYDVNFKSRKYNEELCKTPKNTIKKQLAKVIGITPDGIKRQLDKLKKAGKIRHVCATKKGHWEIIE